ncbi:PAS domain S-box protein [Desulfovibrio mangrovi]|uniref:PAS domain S-box protein n=1 Tax=Desulfovibrio mangrovi TaxID=2976983 RepID=UPI0022468FAF|nr:PAS domain S-box protein [Desulfovibrio mangrovi]UZP68847.1 PAS domain S-box protein [Desulfovibrio mangrovi]
MRTLAFNMVLIITFLCTWGLPYSGIPAPWRAQAAKAEDRSPVAEPLVIGIPEVLAPDYVALDMNSSGFAMESMAYIADAAGYSLVVRRYPDMAAVLQELAAGRIQAVPLLPIREEYRKVAIFSSPLRVDDVTLFVLADSRFMSSIADLQGRKVGVVRSGVGLVIARELAGVLIREAGGVEQLIFMLLSGQVDAIIHPDAAVRFHINRMGLDNRIATLGGRLLQQRYALAVAVGQDAVLGRLEKQVQQFVDSPPYHKLVDKWFLDGGGAERAIPLGWILAVCAVGFLTGGLVFWFGYHRRLSRERHAMFRSLLNASTDAMMLVSAEGDCILGNKAADRVFSDLKYGAGQSGFVRLFGEDDRERRLRSLRRVATSGEVADALHDHGGRILRLSLFPIPRQSGELALVAVTFRDVTERNAKDQLLRDTLKNFGLIFDQAPGGIALLNNNMTVASVNPAFARFLGYAREELEGRSLRDLLYQDDAEDTRLEMHKLFAGEVDRINVEKRFAHKSGIPLWASLTVIAERSDVGVLGSLMAYVVDIHERKVSAERLREGELRYREIFERASDLIFLVNLSTGRIEEFNQAAVASLGYSDSELAGLDSARLEVDVADSGSGVLFAEGLVESKVRRKDGAVLDVQAHTRFLSAAGRLYALSIIRDVSGYREVEACLSRVRLAKDEAVHATESFFGNISEELRTPLQGMMGMLQLLEETPLSDLQRRYVRMSRESGEGLMQFMDDLLDYALLASASAGSGEGQRDLLRPFVVDDMMQTILNSFAAEMSLKGGKLTARIGAEFPEMLIGPAPKLRKMLFNMVGYAARLLENADVRFELRQPKEPRVMADGTRMTEFVVGVASDYSREWAACARKAIGGECGAFECAGTYGLVLASRIAGNLKGTLSVEVCGDWDELVLAIPLRWSPVERDADLVRTMVADIVSGTDEAHGVQDTSYRAGREDNPTSQMLRRADLAPILSGVRIIVADDDGINRVVIGRWLELYGGVVAYAENGVEVFGLLDEEAFDCIVLDLQMPEMNGLDVARAIRSGRCGEAFSAVPIVALTAFAGKENEDACLEAGMNAFLTKPLDLRQLSGVLARVLETGEVLTSAETKAMKVSESESDVLILPPN